MKYGINELCINIVCEINYWPIKLKLIKNLVNNLLLT